MLLMLLCVWVCVRVCVCASSASQRLRGPFPARPSLLKIYRLPLARGAAGERAAEPERPPRAGMQRCNDQNSREKRQAAAALCWAKRRAPK
jgi:hypothetical protein